MGTLYTSQSAAGYNSSPPPDDGSQGANNQITWGTTIKAKLADPIKALADAINSQLTTALDLSPRAISTPDSAVASDHWRTLQVTGTTTITLSDAATMTNKYVVGIANLGVGTVTVTRATGADTVNGTAADFTLAPKQAVMLGVNQGATGYNILAHSLASGAGINTIQATTSVVTPLVTTSGAVNLGLGVNAASNWIVDGATTNFYPLADNTQQIGRNDLRIKQVFTPILDSGTTGSLSLKTNNGTTQLELTHAAGANHVTITSATNPTISTTAGNLAVGTVLDLGSTGQLQFPATQNPSAGVNVLDDYEEGTWTPSLGGNTTYVSQAGTYTKIGRLVSVQGQLVISTIGTGSTTTISGLPFTVGSSSFPMACRTISAAATSIVSATAYGITGTTTVGIFSRTAASAVDSSNAIFANTTNVVFSGHYEV